MPWLGLSVSTQNRRTLISNQIKRSGWRIVDCIPDKQSNPIIEEAPDGVRAMYRCVCWQHNWCEFECVDVKRRELVGVGVGVDAGVYVCGVVCGGKI